MVMVFLLLSAGEVNQDVPLWKKLSYSIGYSGGICYRGGDLASTPTTLYDPIGILACNIYFLNSIEAGVIYPFGDRKGIEVGVGYGWARIEDARGLESIYYVDSVSGEEYSIGTFGTWRIFSTNFFILKSSGGIKYGLEILFSYTKNKEGLWQLHPLKLIEEHNVIRYCVGGGIVLRLEKPIIYGSNPNLGFYASLKMSGVTEFKNTSPWKWKDKLKVSFSGIFIGIRLKWGGAK